MMPKPRLFVLAVPLTLLVVARPGRLPAETPGPIAALAEGIASGRVVVIDLTQILNERTPVIKLPPPFGNTPGLEKNLISRFDDQGPAWYWNWLKVGEHAGTHFDAPCHWISGKDKPCVDQIPAAQFIGPAAVIDARDEVAKNPDFVVSKRTLLDFEARHGRIPARAWVVLESGWGARAADAKAFLNLGADGRPHYPGFGLESARFLSEERDVLGVATEAIGTDAALGAGAEPPFPNHFTMHGAGKFGLTQLANVELLPPTGALIIATPLKVEGGSGSPVRAIALVPLAGTGPAAR